MGIGKLGGGLGRLGGAGSLNLPSIYEGFVATRCQVPTVLVGGLPYWNSRSGHYARTDITAIRVHIPNWYVPDTDTDTGTGVSQTYTASIEYPAGVFKQVTFGGSASGTTASATTLSSDLMTVAIPKDTLFWVRLYGVNNTGGFAFQSTSVTGATLSSPTIQGDKLEFSATLIADKTMGGTIANSDVTFAVRPLALTGPTRAPGVIIFGDSIGVGISDQINALGDGGVVNRWIGPNFGYCNMCKGGSAVFNFVTGSKSILRRGMLPYASHVICQHGNNDIWGISRTATQVAADWATQWAYATALGKPVYQLPIIMRTTSNDGWATVGGQTKTNVTMDGYRQTLNANLRGGVYTQLAGFFEDVYPIESAQNSGLFAAPPVLTADGVHPNATGFLPIQTLNQPLALAAIKRT